MAKIKTLRINNFKFFGNEEQPLSIDSKHLLIYGENGSGKSTLYWALYTLLEAASKQSDEDIKKYFRKGVSDLNSLVNIHATQTPAGDFNSFIEAELDNGTTYRISLSDTSIRTNIQAQLSNSVTDFVNYRMMYKAYDFAHSEENDLFLLFENEILPYVDFSPIQFGTGVPLITEIKASKILNNLWKGSGVHNKKSPQHQTFLGKVMKFNQDLRSLLTHINTRGNEILKNDLGYQNFEFLLELSQEVNVDIKGNKTYPKISLKIPNFNGVAGVIHKPHSFLNEARISALALSIRLAVLEKNYNSTAELRLLVLDDLLLSLDMANRDKVLEILLNRYVHQYQILLMTHEYRFFEITKKRIQSKGLENGWLFKEMYVSESAGSPPKPIILPSETYLGKAKKYFSEFDFAASGNFLRKESESFVKKFLPQRLRRDKNSADLNLEGMIKASIEFAKANSLTTDTQNNLKALDEHRKFIFNALSHDSFDVSNLKSDLISAFDTLAYLRNIESKTILKMGDSLTFELIDLAGDVHNFDIQVCDEVKVIKENLGALPIVSKCPYLSTYTKNGIRSPNSEKFNDIKSFYDKKYNLSDKTINADFSESILLSDGQPLKSKIQ